MNSVLCFSHLPRRQHEAHVPQEGSFCLLVGILGQNRSLQCFSKHQWFTLLMIQVQQHSLFSDFGFQLLGHYELHNLELGSQGIRRSQKARKCNLIYLFSFACLFNHHSVFMLSKFHSNWLCSESLCFVELCWVSGMELGISFFVGLLAVCI